MKVTLSILAFSSAVTVLAQTNLDPETSAESFANYLQNICFPYNQTDGSPFFDAPCNAAQNILIECTYGPQYNFTDSGTDSNNNLAALSNTTQQACICESQFWDQQQGCNDCFIAHGDTDFGAGLSNNVFTTLSSSYCAASATPTLGFADWLQVAGESVLHTISAPGTTQTSYSDPIGSKTAVSLYFTPSVTGSAAWNAVAATGALHTISGQIVATASAVHTADNTNPLQADSTGSPTSVPNSGATTSSSHAAAGTPQAMAAAAGVIGFAGLVALM